jgi:hypothetical protein
MFYMKKSHLTILMMLCWVLLLVPMSVSAQAGPGDQDGDGIPDSTDLCPTRPGPTVTMGCGDTDGDTLRDDVDLCPDNFGTVQSGGCPDSDGDGILDNADACPTQGGPDTNRGCPTDQSSNTVPENSTNPVRPVVGGDCTVATFLTAAVNVREYPAPDAPVLGTLDPSALYPVFGMHMIGDAVWYLVEGGWVSGVAVVLGGDCGGMVGVHYVPDYGRLPAEFATEESLARYCIPIIGDYKICWGKGPILSNTPDQGSTAGWQKLCKGIKGWIACTAIPEIAYAIWDWWNEDEGAEFDPTTNPDRLIFDDPTPDPDGENAGKSKVCKGIKGKIICFLVEEIVSAIWDWWNEDESTEAQVDPRLIDPRFTTVFVPANGNSTGDQSTNDGSAYPLCEDLMNRVIVQHTTSDGSSPVQSEIIGDYLVTYLVLNPAIPLPEPEPCVKWVDAPIDAGKVQLQDFHLVSGYRVQYDSWPPAGWHTDILGGNSTVPMVALLLPAVQSAREAPRPAHHTPYDGAWIIDFLGNSTVDEDGGVFFGFVVPDGELEAGYLKLGDIKGE